MTTFARGVPHAQRAGGAISSLFRSTTDHRAVTDAGDLRHRSFIAVEDAERRAIQRDHAWVEAAALASLRLPRG